MVDQMLLDFRDGDTLDRADFGIYSISIYMNN